MQDIPALQRSRACLPSPELAPMDQSHKPKLLVMPADPDIGHAVRGPLWAASSAITRFVTLQFDPLAAKLARSPPRLCNLLCCRLPPPSLARQIVSLGVI